MKFAFRWDPRKAAGNARKHAVSFEEAGTVFSDPLAVTIPDGGHSAGERRYLTFGVSSERRVLVVSHTEFGVSGIHIISARRVDRDERRFYEEG